MAAPEWLAIDSDAFIDACAQDVWSIGCLIYRMLTGCMAWEAEGSSYQFVMGILQAHRQWVSIACTSWYPLGNPPLACEPQLPLHGKSSTVWLQSVAGSANTKIVIASC